MNRALNSNDGGEAGIQRIQADYWASELARARERLDRTQLRSPINGVVVTPHVEDMVGRKLLSGDTFAEVVDTSRAIVDVAIDADDVLLLHSGRESFHQVGRIPHPHLPRGGDGGQPAKSGAGRRPFFLRSGLRPQRRRRDS